VTDPNYFFWSGRSKRKSEVSNWQKIFAKVLSTARGRYAKLFLERDGQSKPAHLHMLRDTFAVEYLLAGMPLEEVSRLLGHSSVLITQKHYAPWVLQRQQPLAASQRVAWATMGVQEQERPRRNVRSEVLFDNCWAMNLKSLPQQQTKPRKQTIKHCVPS
jgi:hypothetical protein